MSVKIADDRLAVRRLDGSDPQSGGRSIPLKQSENEHHHNAQPADPIMDGRC
jgi:hypothetical protein